MSKSNKTPRLNRAGILQLADDLIANAKLYGQYTFGEKHSCGTVRCMAGQCLATEIGIRKYNKLVKEYWDNSYVSHFPDQCAESGKTQLGITTENTFPQIFESQHFWPDDLETEMDYAVKPLDKVIVALKALQRLLPNGDIDEKKKVHTRIPQLAQLLEEKSAAKKATR